MTRWKHIGTLVLLYSLFAGCSHHRLMDGAALDAPEPFWNWGGGPGRCGFVADGLEFPLDLAWMHKAQAGVERALCAVDDCVVFGTKDGTLILLDAERGKPERRIRYRKKSGVTCAVDGVRLISAQRWEGNALEAAHWKTLERIWLAPTDFVEGEPLLAGGSVVVAGISGKVFCFDIDSGSRVWERRLGAPVAGSPASAEGSVFLADTDGSLWSLGLGEGDIRWRRRFPGTFVAGPMTGGGALFVGSKEGRFYAVDASTGETLWEERTRGGVFEAAAAAGGFVFYGTARGDLVCRDAVRGEERWRLTTDAAIGASPLVTENAVVFGNLDGVVYAADRRDGGLLWEYRARGRVRTTPLVWNGMLICASEDEYVYGFRPKN